MKKAIGYIMLLSLLIGAASCKKFLTDAPQTSLTTGNAYNSATDIENALAGCYNIFYTDYYIWEDIMLSDNRSDNAYPGGGGEETFVDEDQFSVPSNNSHIYLEWTQLYQGIARCNLLLAHLNTAIPDLSSTRQNQIIGEAHFLRAFHYYQLVKTWGGVPIELESNSADPAVTRKPRSTEAQVYDQINADLQVALADLPDTYGQDASVNKVRATKGAANALLAKIWAQRTDRDYNKTLTYCDDVINSAAGYSLLSNYSYLFDGAHYLSSESIMEIPFIAGSANSNWGVELYLAPEDGYQKYCVPSKDLVNAYTSAGDSIRENANIIFLKADANGNPIAWADENWNPCQDPNVAIPFNYKQKHADSYASGDHLYLLRLADIILLKAEAENELGKSSSAITDLNTVRARVNLSPVSSSLSQSDLRSAILKERRLELAFEGQRWDDLTRLGVATQVMTALTEYKYTCSTGSESAPIKITYNCDKNHWLMPIPQVEMNSNPNLTQNPGYN